MEVWFLILISISIASLLRAIFIHFSSENKPPHNLPPGPLNFPIISSFLWIRKSVTELEPMLRSLHAKHGPMVTLRFTSRLAIFISDSSLAHHALVQHGAVFADRPPAIPTVRIRSSNQHTINSCPYGPNWRLLRRNLTAEILHPSRVSSYSHAREGVLQILKDSLELKAKTGDPFGVVELFRYAMFCLLVLMCFGDKLDQKQFKEIEKVEHSMLVNTVRYNVLNFMPNLSKLLFRKRWDEFLQLQKDEEDVLIPLIRERKKANEARMSSGEESSSNHVLAYIDTLFDLQLPEENRKLNEGEMVALCHEFLNAGTDTTTTAMQWIMANLVKYPDIQEKLYMEMKGVVKEGEEEVKEEELQKMPYLKAIVLEGLRKHPPGHFLLPHAVTEDVVLGKYLIPKKGSVNFMVLDIGRDPKVWEDPMEFKPERFVNREGEAFDITGSREIKMMPFGVGRRICPGFGLAMLHLEYFVANLVWSFEWKAANGDEVDLSEKQEFTTVMKYPLQASISPRSK